MKARIYQPAKTAMQSGRGRTHHWILECEPTAGKSPDPLMGWASSSDMNRQWRLRFDSREAAEAYAEKRGISYTVEEPSPRRFRPKSYAANFKWDRPS